MGDIADMMLEGVLCERCGEYIGDEVGHPRLCNACELGRPPCGECTNCEIAEQSKEISLLANEAVLDGHEPHKSTGCDPLEPIEPTCGKIYSSEQLCIEDCPRCQYYLGS